MGELLKRLRDEQELTQKALAEKAGVSVDAVRNYEQGRREPTISAVKRIAKALGVDSKLLIDAVPEHPPDH